MSNSKRMKSNELKLIIEILTRLEKRIYLLQLSLHGGTGKATQLKRDFSNPTENDENNTLHSYEESKTKFDCHDIQLVIRRILNELNEFGTFETLEDSINEYKNINRCYERHKKLLMAKEQEIAEVKRILSMESEKVEARKVNEKSEEHFHQQSKTLDKLPYVKQLMDYKVKSKQDYYEDNFKVIKENIQTYTKELDLLLRKTYDNWALKEREIAILKKYRKLNLEKIEKVSKQIIIREEVIGNYRMEKKAEKEKHYQDNRKSTAATILQAHWRGTMVRKHLGPYKIAKTKKKKGKKEKGKKK